MKQRRPEGAATPAPLDATAAADAVAAPVGEDVAAEAVAAPVGEDVAAEVRPSASRRSKLAVVPDLAGLSTGDAVELLRELELCPALEPAEVHDSAQAGHVVEQFPAEGNELARGDVVDVYVGQSVAEVDAARAADDESWYAAADAPVASPTDPLVDAGDSSAPVATERDDAAPRATGRRRKRRRGPAGDRRPRAADDRAAEGSATAATSLADIAAAPAAPPDDRRYRLVMRSALGVSIALVVILGVLMLVTGGDHQAAPAATTPTRTAHRSDAGSPRRTARPTTRARAPRPNVSRARRLPAHRRPRIRATHIRRRRKTAAASAPALAPSSSVTPSYPRPAPAPPVDGCEACAERP